MGTIQLIQVTPTELADLISESVKAQLKELYQELKESPKTEEAEFISRKETAELFKISLVTVHEWSKLGLIKPYKLGNRTYYKRSELLEKLYSSNTH
jgi:hypothetical protein